MNGLVPVPTTLNPAPDSILRYISVNIEKTANAIVDAGRLASIAPRLHIVRRAVCKRRTLERQHWH